MGFLSLELYYEVWFLDLRQSPSQSHYEGIRSKQKRIFGKRRMGSFRCIGIQVKKSRGEQDLPDRFFKKATLPLSENTLKCFAFHNFVKMFFIRTGMSESTTVAQKFTRT